MRKMLLNIYIREPIMPPLACACLAMTSSTTSDEPYF